MNLVNSLNFRDLLLEFYKELNISEDSLVILSMISLLNEKEESITTYTLSRKTNYNNAQVDKIMSDLFRRKFLNLTIEDGKSKLSLDNLNRLLYEKYQEKYFNAKIVHKDVISNESRMFFFEEFAKTFDRDLTPREINFINTWLEDGISGSIIFEALGEAMMANKLNIMYIDQLILKKTKYEKK